MGSLKQRGVRESLAILCAAVLFSLMTVAFQVKELELAYLEEGGGQAQRHADVLRGTAIDPWQYRVLSEYLVEGVLRAVKELGLPHPMATGFLLFRLFQNTLLFVLVAAYYRKLGLNAYLSLLGMSLLALGMTHSVYDSDLQFSTYSDVIFYLLAGLVVLQGRILWIPPIAALAALNRESSLLIPLMTFGSRPLGSRGGLQRAILIAAGSFGVALAIVGGLRFFMGQRLPGMTPPPGTAMLEHNLSRYESWVYLFATLGLLPIMAVASMPRWPVSLKIFFWAMVPAWFAVHLLTSVIAETRLFLVPHALIFVPGALLGISYWTEREL